MACGKIGVRGLEIFDTKDPSQETRKSLRSKFPKHE